MSLVRRTRRLVLEERVAAPDGSGGQVTTWRTLGVLWADVRALAGREVFVAARATGRVRYRILVRGAPVGAASRPKAEQRLRDGARIFAILTVAEHDRLARHLEIVAEEVQA